MARDFNRRDKMAIPKGRMTIRKSGGKRVRLWEAETKPGTILERLEWAYVESLATVDAMEVTRAKLFSDRRFTDAGAKEEFRKHVLTNAIPVFYRGRMTIQKAQAELAEKRVKLQPQKPDPTDAAAAIARMEIRTWLRGLPQAERDAVTESSSLDPQIRQAIMEAPAQMTNVAASHRELSRRA
jgi:hypothetical protein